MVTAECSSSAAIRRWDQHGPDLRATLYDLQAQADLTARAIAKLVDVGGQLRLLPRANGPAAGVLEHLVVEAPAPASARGRAAGSPPRSIRSCRVWRKTRSAPERVAHAPRRPDSGARGRRRPEPHHRSHVSGRGRAAGRAYRPRRLAGAAGRTPPAGTLDDGARAEPRPCRPPIPGEPRPRRHDGVLSATSTVSSASVLRSSCPRSRIPTPHEDPGG